MAVREIDTSALISNRKSTAIAENTIFLAREKLKRLNEDRDRLLRYLDEENDMQVRELRSIDKRILDEQKSLETHAGLLQSMHETHAGIWDMFVGFTDPRSNLNRLDENYPILLLPLRIETRFKEIVSDNGGLRHQLWVRAYPDDCSIDTFEENLSESEILDAETFWMDYWAAAGDESARRAAWRYLADGHGYGRAQHIFNTYLPASHEEILHSGEDLLHKAVFLVINGEYKITEEEKEILAVFWPDYYRALVKNELEGMNAATEALYAQLEEERAVYLIKEFPPKNIGQLPPEMGENEEFSVEVKFIEFVEDPDLQQEAWSHAPRISIMPERLCLQAYIGEKKVIDRAGELIPFPLIVGPDPKMSKADMFVVPGTDVEVTRDMRWMVDFEEAVLEGMAFKIDLTGDQVESGFDRLFVLGVKMSATRKEGKEELEELIQHHYYGNSGFSFLPVGTPTNNTLGSESGYSESEDADDSYDLVFNASGTNGNGNENGSENPFWWNKTDREWFCEMLGLSGDVFHNTINTDGRDQLEARAMNVALWPATWGYFFETMLEGTLSDEQVRNIRWYFNNFVVGRGTLPSIRIDDQPYGILPVTAFSRMQWLSESDIIKPEDISHQTPANFSRFLYSLNSKFSIIQNDWKRMSEKVSHVGSDGDPHALLLDILGLHGGSVEFHNRIGESFDHIYNLYLIASKKKPVKGKNFPLKKISDSASSDDVTVDDVINAMGNSIGGRLLLNELGYTGKENPKILEKLFVLNAEKLIGPLIDDKPLSEDNSIRSYSTFTKEDGVQIPENYLDWLIRIGETSFEALRKEEGFTDKLRPNALLYLMLKYALEQSYFLTSTNLFKLNKLLPDNVIQAAKSEASFMHIQSLESSDNQVDALRSESKYTLLYQKQAEITGSSDMRVFEYIPEALKEGHIATEYLYEQTQALRLLSASPTARLERAFTEHIDCASYRFDAWKFGMVNYQLKALRNRREQIENHNETEIDSNEGLYIGAYGWLENVRSENKELIPRELPDELKEVFNASDSYPIHEDKSNLGYINAPSLNHAVTSAILRNGYDAYASEDNAELFNVNLSSERVRKALKIIEGIQNGQSLAALLGYEFEREMHDNNTLANLDQYIFKIRRKFPLGSNQIKSTYEDNEEDVSIEKMEARNVVHGLDLIDFAEKDLGPNNEPLYFDDLGLGAVSGQVKTVIVSAISNIRDNNDAVADLAFAESVHQVAQGNVDRAAGTLDAYGSGNYPQIPEVVQTPRSGVNITHRVGIHIKANAQVDTSLTPRAMAEPGLNLFLQDILPPLSKIKAYASFYHLASDTEIEDHPVSMADLGLQPIDLLYLIDTNSEQAMTALDDCIVNHLLQNTFPVQGGSNQFPRPDTDIRIKYLNVSPGDVSVFEIASLIGHLKNLLQNSRSLKAGDVLGSDEASSGTDSFQSLDKGRIDAVIQFIETSSHVSLQNKSPKVFLDDFVSTLSISLGEGGDDDSTIISNIDNTINAFMSLLQILAPIGLPQTGTGFLTQWKKTQLSGIFTKISDLIQVWSEKEAEYNSLTLNFNPTDAGAMDLLLKAERVISTETTLNPGNDPAVFKTSVLDAVKLPAFLQKRKDFQDFINTNFLKLSDVLNDVEALLAYEDFYLVETDVEDIRKSCRLFADELLNKAKLLQTDLKDRTNKSKNNLTTKYDAESDPLKRIRLIQEAGKILLSEEFKMIPSFSIPTTQSHEWDMALGKVDDLLDYQLNTLNNPLPVDDWFYGVARVREKLGNMEQAIMLLEGFAVQDIELTPVQFPRIDPYCWFASEFGNADTEMNKKVQEVFKENDHMLYTAYYHEPFAVDQDLCGLLIDEWTEIIPTEDETTGIAFHYDRPNSEPPQALLLAVSPQLNGDGWNWDDLVAILHETLDEARLRAVEPEQIENDRTSYNGFTGLQYNGYANLLPATISTVTKYPVSIMLNYAFNNLPITANIVTDG